MIATLVFLFSAVFAHAGVDEAELRVKFASAALQEGLYQCPERVWPGVNWAATGVIFVSRDLNKAWFITKGLKGATTIPVSREFASVADFKISAYRGKTVAIVNIDKYIHDKISLPTALAVHELFHQIGQTGWTLASPKRGDFFPLDPKPRVARAMILSEMQRYANGDSTALSRAAYWFARWKSESPDEVQFTTDTREGTAKYVERAVVELAREGCGGDLTEPLLRWTEGQSPLTYFGLDAEGYVLGAVAGIFLDRAGVEWKQSVAHGLSPLEMLFNGVVPVAGNTDMDVTRAIDMKVFSVNGEVARLEEPLLSPTSAEEYYRVTIPDTWVGPSINLLGIFVPRAAIDQTYLIFSYGQEFKSARRGGDWMVLTSPALGLSGGADAVNPCGDKRGIQFLVPKSQVTQSGAVFTAHTGALDFEFSARAISRNGLMYLCPVTR